MSSSFSHCRFMSTFHHDSFHGCESASSAKRQTRNFRLTHEYSGQWRTAQQPDKNIGKMVQVPLPKGKSELLIHANYARIASYPAPGDTLRSDGPSNKAMAVNKRGLIGPCQSSLEIVPWRSISVTTSSVLVSNKHNIPPVVTSKSPFCCISPSGRRSLKAHQSTQHKLIQRLIPNCQMNEGRYLFLRAHPTHYS